MIVLIVKFLEFLKIRSAYDFFLKMVKKKIVVIIFFGDFFSELKSLSRNYFYNYFTMKSGDSYLTKVSKDQLCLKNIQRKETRANGSRESDLKGKSSIRNLTDRLEILHNLT